MPPDEAKELRINFARWLAPQYLENELKIANLCDETLDRSGALLGYVRHEATLLKNKSVKPA
jgi:hypothetical protein